MPRFDFSTCTIIKVKAGPYDCALSLCSVPIMSCSRVAHYNDDGLTAWDDNYKQ